MQSSGDKIWYALYTKSRNEKKAHAALLSSGIESFLPLIKNLKQWSDRKKWVEEPLFRSYLFVHIFPAEYYTVLNAFGVVRYVTFEGHAVVVPPQQILAIKQYLNAEDSSQETLPVFEQGDKVEIFRGALKGLTGKLIRLQGKQKVIIEIESIGQSITLTIPGSHLRILKIERNR
jgi:transcription antitermination factor NusG